MDSPRIQNLRRWVRSGAGVEFVESHDGEWADDDWSALVAELKDSDFWPLSLRAVGLQLEEQKRLYAAATERIVSKAVRASLGRALAVYAVGVGVVGFLVGAVAGASSTPVISSLLPLLFAVLGGTGGVYVATIDLSQPSSPGNIRVVGSVLLSFAAATILGLATGIVARYQTETRLNKTAPRTCESVEGQLELGLLRSRLAGLHVPAEEQRAVLLKATKENDATRVPVDPSVIKDIHDTALRSADAIRQVGTQASVSLALASLDTLANSPKALGRLDGAEST
jgi:hypothetical protein